MNGDNFLKNFVEGKRKQEARDKLVMQGQLETLYGMRIIPDKKCKLRIMEYRGNEAYVHPDLYGCLKVIDPENWENFFRMVGITFKRIKIRKVF